MEEDNVDEKVKQLAETLKSKGLAASMYEATEKAKSILGVREVDVDDKKEEGEDRFSKRDYDVKREKVSLNELMQEVGVTEDQVKEQEMQKVDKIKEEVDDIKEDIQTIQKKSMLAGGGSGIGGSAIMIYLKDLIFGGN